MTRSRRDFVCAGPLAIAAALSSCRSPPARYYRLAPLPGATLPSANVRIGVLSVSTPDYLDQNGIAQGGGGYQFLLYNNDLWAGRLADMLQAVMVQNLAQRLPQATVIGGGGSIDMSFDVVVEIDVLRFDADSTGQMLLSAQIAIKPGHGHAFFVTRSLTKEDRIEQNTAADRVAAMSRLWATTADQIAAMVIKADNRS